MKSGKARLEGLLLRLVLIAVLIIVTTVGIAATLAARPVRRKLMRALPTWRYVTPRVHFRLPGRQRPLQQPHAP
jgi:hypothetical protein